MLVSSSEDVDAESNFEETFYELEDPEHALIDQILINNNSLTIAIGLVTNLTDKVPEQGDHLNSDLFV